MLLRFSFVLLTAIAFLVALPIARAADGAEDLIRRALELRRRGDDESARPLFRQAYDLAHTPRAAVQLGFCEQALGRWVEAQTYLSEGLKAEKDQWVTKNRQVIESALFAIKGHIARVEITGEPTGAEVLVNGAVVGKLPMTAPARVAAGEIQLEVRAPGYVPGSKAFRIEGGQYQRLVMRLQAASPPGVVTPPPVPAVMATAAPQTGVAAVSPPSTPPTVAPPTPVPTQSEMVPVATTVPASDHTSIAPWRGALKWVAWGTAALGLGVGVYGVMENKSGVKEFDSGCANDAQGVPFPTGGTRTVEQCRGLKSDYEFASQLGIGGFVSAGVLAAAGLVLFLTEPDGGQTPTAMTLRCAPRWGGDTNVGLNCGWRF